jgi:predicted  nucleic acid-binding Zn-ribbon protein
MNDKGPSSEEPDFFLTEVNHTRNLQNASANLKETTKEFLETIRKDNEKLLDVVAAFRNKVDKMVDKQRSEYILAYEGHMQDIQRELHNLRDKVQEIANNQTKNERTEKLKAEITRLKNDAIQLETESDDLRSKMSKTVQKIYTVGNIAFFDC